MVRVKASHILVKTEAEAKEIMQKIKAGDDFAKLAKLYSQCPSGNAGGDLGYFGKGRWSNPSKKHVSRLMRAMSWARSKPSSAGISSK